MKKLIPLLLIIFISNQLFAQDALKKYLEDKIIYPETAISKNVSGCVNMLITIDEKGTKQNTTVYTGIGENCTQVCHNAINNIPNWNEYITGWHQYLTIQIPILFVNNNSNENVMKFPKILMDTIFDKKKIITNNNKTYEYVDSMPEFPGGEDKLMSLIGNELKYPRKASDNSTQGRVIINFVINETGNMTEFKIEKGIGDGCDEEALRVLKSFPKWSPGFQNNKAVRVFYSLPITFELEDDGELSNYEIIKKDTIKIYNSLAVKPAFEGGKTFFKDTLQTIILKQLSNTKSKKSGVIEATFTVIENGTLSNILITKSINEEYDNVVKSSLKSLPKFQFVTPNNKPVTYTVVIPFE